MLKDITLFTLECIFYRDRYRFKTICFNLFHTALDSHDAHTVHYSRSCETPCGVSTLTKKYDQKTSYHLKSNLLLSIGVKEKFYCFSRLGFKRWSTTSTSTSTTNFLRLNVELWKLCALGQFSMLIPKMVSEFAENPGIRRKTMEYIKKLRFVLQWELHQVNTYWK